MTLKKAARFWNWNLSDRFTPEQDILLAELDEYRGVDPAEEAHRVFIRKHVASTHLWWHRDTMPGHVTELFRGHTRFFDDASASSSQARSLVAVWRTR